jgi:hypothetical protein
LVEFFGCGYLKPFSNKSAVCYAVTDINNIVDIIIPFFNNYTINGSKNLDYSDFCKIAYLIKDKAHLTEEGLNQIKELASSMNLKRESDFFETSKELPDKSCILGKKTFISSKVKLEVIDLKKNEEFSYSSLLKVASDFKINIKSIVARFKTKSEKPFKGRYIIKYNGSDNNNNIFIKNYVLFINDKGDILTFSSINSARLYFNVKWSLIKNNLDKDNFVNINGVS